MTSSPDPKPLQYSAMQLAWLHELGIDKPWLPGDTRAVSVAGRSGEAAVSVKTEAQPQTAAALNRGAMPAQRQSAIEARQNVGAASAADEGKAALTAPAAAPTTPVRPSTRGAATKPQQAAAPMSAVSIAAMTALTAAAAAAAPDLELLTLAASACQACGLCRQRDQVVMGQGVTQPAVLVIGDGPGEQEDRKGLPFMAESGALLDQMLSTIGSARTRDVYLTNLVKCRPPGNRLAQREEIAACHSYLVRQLELLRPFSILALGRNVAQTLLNTDEPLQNLRGRVHTLEVAGQKIPLVASYHSAHLLNHPADKAAAWQDLQLLRTLRR
jgi:uracil-DNA glycosylase family 4